MKKLFVLILPFLLIVGCSNDTSTESADAEESENNVTSGEQDNNSEADADHDSATNNEADSDLSNASSESQSPSDSTSSDSVSKDNENTESNKDEYIHKLEEVEAGLASLEEEDDSQLEMNKAEGEIFERWDDALNEIYGTLEAQLSDGAMGKLREEQREWVEQRDKTAEEEAAPYEGGSMESYEYVATQAQLTKERCYELVENYMNG